MCRSRFAKPFCLIVSVLLTTSPWFPDSRQQMSFGQEALPSNRRTVMDAIRSIDTLNEKEAESLVAFLEQSIEKDSVDTLAHCGLAIMQFRARSFDAAKLSFEKAGAANAARPTRLTTAKFQLVCAINTEDAELATSLFQSLLNACQRESTPIALRKSYCEWMGEVIGVLDFEEAKSPIASEILTKAKKSLMGIAETKLAQAFTDRYTLSHLKALEIRKALLRFEEIGEAGLQELDKSLSDDIEKAEQTLADALKESREISNETQTALKTLRLELLSIRDQLRKNEAESARPGPGMPIPVPQPLGPPPRPIREAIYVDPFYLRLVVEIVDGRRIERYVRERRDFRDIEAERNNIFQRQMIQYQSLMDSYNIQQANYSQYQKDLAAWRKSEDERRKQLAQQRRDLEGISVATKANIDAIESKKKDTSEVTAIRNQISLWKTERDSYRSVLEATKSGNPHRALRPRTLSPSLITDEKNLLLKQLAEIQ
jgi:hypothetical protein